MITLNTDRPMCRAGDDSPCMLMHVQFIGEMDEEKNKRCSAAFYNFLKSETNLPQARFARHFIALLYTTLYKDVYDGKTRNTNLMFLIYESYLFCIHKTIDF